MGWLQADESHPKEVNSAIAVFGESYKMPRDPTDVIPGNQHPKLRFYGRH
jgi:hypothetical protein